MSEKITMLIVDDSRLSRAMIRRFAASIDQDLEFLEAGDAVEALSVVAGHHPDIMTIDYNMPGMNGLDLAVELKELYPNASSALVTANVQQALRQRASEIGIDFIDKPIPEAKITDFVVGALPEHATT